MLAYYLSPTPPGSHRALLKLTNDKGIQDLVTTKQSREQSPLRSPSPRKTLPSLDLPAPIGLISPLST